MTGRFGASVHGLVFAHEDLLRGVRAIGLVLIDERRRRVQRLAILVDLRAGHHHEIGAAVIGRERNAVRPCIEERIVRLQGDIHRAVVTLRDQVEAVIEELAEIGHPGVVGRRQPFVGSGVGDDERVALHFDAVSIERESGELLIGHEAVFVIAPGAVQRLDCRRCVAFIAGLGQGCRNRSRVSCRLVDDEVGDDARIGIGHVAGCTVIGVGDGHAGTEGHDIAVLVVEVVGREHARQDFVRSAPALAAVHQIVVAAIDRAQAVGQVVVAKNVVETFARCMTFCDADLFEDELEIIEIQCDGHCTAPSNVGRWTARSNKTDGGRKSSLAKSGGWFCCS